MDVEGAGSESLASADVAKPVSLARPRFATGEGKGKRQLTCWCLGRCRIAISCYLGYGRTLLLLLLQGRLPSFDLFLALCLLGFVLCSLFWGIFPLGSRFHFSFPSSSDRYSRASCWCTRRFFTGIEVLKADRLRVVVVFAVCPSGGCDGRDICKDGCRCFRCFRF